MTTPALSLTGLLVGMHFHPPAKALLEHLPTGATLLLRAEPDNPYDDQAIQVWLDPEAVPTSQHQALRDTLPGMGADWDELLAEGTLVTLGHVAKSEGRPLAGTGYQGNLEFHKAGLPMVVELRFDPQGRPTLWGPLESPSGLSTESEGSPDA